MSKAAANRRNNTFGLYDAKTRFSELVERAETGEEITITRHGAAVAKLVPVKKELTVQERRARIERWIETSKSLSLGGLKVKDMIAEGRR